MLSMGGLKSIGGSPLAGLVGQDIAAASITLSGVAAVNLSATGRITWDAGNYITNNAATGLFVATSGFRADAGSGSNGLVLNTAGARLKLSTGGTTDYMISDGSETISAAGNFSVSGRLIATGDSTSPVNSNFRIVPQDAEPTGANAVGDMYVTTAGVLKICTVAGTPGTWVSVGAQ